MNVPDTAAFEVIGRQALEIYLLRQQLAAIQAERAQEAQQHQPPAEEGLTRAED